MTLDDPAARIRLSKALCRFIQTERKENNRTAAEVAVSAGHGQSWVAQIENGKTTTIKSDDLINLFKGIWGMDDYKEVATLLVNKLQELKALNSNHASSNQVKISDNEKPYDKFILSDMAIVFEKKMDIIVKIFNSLYAQAPNSTIRILDTIIQNMESNADFQMGLFSIPFYMLSELENDEYRLLYDEISELFVKRINKDQIRINVQDISIEDAD